MFVLENSCYVLYYTDEFDIISQLNLKKYGNNTTQLVSNFNKVLGLYNIQLGQKKVPHTLELLSRPSSRLEQAVRGYHGTTG